MEQLHPQARAGIELFNQGEFHAAHDALELAWLETESPERDLYQGILQIGLAYYQISRGNYRGALKMFQRGQRNLDHLARDMLGVNVEKLQGDARLAEQKLRELGQDGLHLFPPHLIQSLVYSQSNPPGTGFDATQQSR